MEINEVKRNESDQLQENSIKRNLLSLIEAVPQQRKGAGYTYLIMGGVTVDLITNVERPHKDIDLVLLDEDLLLDILKVRGNNELEIYYSHSGHPRDIKLDSDFLQKTAFRVEVANNNSVKEMFVVHPAITLTQKLSGIIPEGESLLSPPRPIDIADATNLLSYEKKHNLTSSWSSISEFVLQNMGESNGRAIQTRRRINEIRGLM